MQLTMAAAAEHVRDDIVFAAGDDEPAAALKWRKTRVPLEGKEWLDWSLAACLRLTIRALPDIFTAVHADLPTTPGFLGRPRSLEPSVVLALAGVVSRACRHFSFCTGAGHSSQPFTFVLMNEHLETLGVLCRFSPYAAASSTSTRRAARCCHRSNALGGLTTPWICLLHVCTVHVSRAALGRTSKGEFGKEWPEANDRPDDTASIGQSIAGLRSLLTGWTHDALQEIATMHHNTAAWSDIVCTDAKRADVLAFATPRHIAGTLFKHHRRRVALELRTIVA